MVTINTKCSINTGPLGRFYQYKPGRTSVICCRSPQIPFPLSPSPCRVLTLQCFLCYSLLSPSHHPAPFIFKQWCTPIECTPWAAHSPVSACAQASCSLWRTNHPQSGQSCTWSLGPGQGLQELLQGHSMAEAGGNLWVHLLHPLLKQGHWIRVSRATSRWLLEISKEDTSQPVWECPSPAGGHGSPWVVAVLGRHSDF